MLYLTTEHLADLTGYQPNQFALMARWLKASGWPFELSRAGCPRVLVAYHDERMRGLAAAAAQTAEAAQAQHTPNFAALKGLHHHVRKTQVALG